MIIKITENITIIRSEFIFVDNRRPLWEHHEIGNGNHIAEQVIIFAKNFLKSKIGSWIYNLYNKLLPQLSTPIILHLH